MEYIDKAIGFLVQWLPIVTSVVGTFALVATITPNKVDDKIGQVLMDVINFLGANIGKASNAGDSDT